MGYLEWKIYIYIYQVGYNHPDVFWIITLEPKEKYESGRRWKKTLSEQKMYFVTKLNNALEKLFAKEKDEMSLQSNICISLCNISTVLSDNIKF